MRKIIREHVGGTRRNRKTTISRQRISLFCNSTNDSEKNINFMSILFWPIINSFGPVLPNRTNVPKACEKKRQSFPTSVSSCPSFRDPSPIKHDRARIHFNNRYFSHIHCIPFIAITLAEACLCDLLPVYCVAATFTIMDRVSQRSLEDSGTRNLLIYSERATVSGIRFMGSAAIASLARTRPFYCDLPRSFRNPN